MRIFPSGSTTAFDVMLGWIRSPAFLHLGDLSVSSIASIVETVAPASVRPEIMSHRCERVLPLRSVLTRLAVGQQ
jgi:hypothetical protein